MPIPGVTAPNTLTIAQAIQTLMQNVTWSTVGGFTAYKTVSIGELKDIENKVPLCVIRGRQGDVERYTTGGKVKDKPRFAIRTYVDFTTTQSALVAEEMLFTIRDAVTELFNQKTALNGTTGVLECMWVPDSEKYEYIPVGNKMYRLHDHTLQVVQSYTIVGGFTQ